MPRFAANLSTMYPDVDFLDRFGAAAADGFAAVECQFPYAWPAADVAARLADHGQRQVLINTPLGRVGDAAPAERGLPCQPGPAAALRAGVHHALDYAAALGCARIHVMSGTAPAGVARERLVDTIVDNLRWAGDRAADAGVTLVVEPLNPRDNPGYFLQRQADAHAIVATVGSPAVKVMLDLYHCQIVEGDLATALRRDLPSGRVGHLQIAGVPERHEPDVGEIRFPYLLDLIDALGWDGFVGCEYRPRDRGPGGTSRGLGWLHAFRAARS